jgi:hypothetical protein
MVWNGIVLFGSIDSFLENYKGTDRQLEKDPFERVTESASFP